MFTLLRVKTCVLPCTVVLAVSAILCKIQVYKNVRSTKTENIIGPVSNKAINEMRVKLRHLD